MRALRLAGSCRQHFGPFAGNPNRLLEIQKIRRIFRFPADFLFFQRKICFSRWRFYFPADFLIFRLNFKISGGIFRAPLEIWIFCWKFCFPADFLNFQRDRFLGGRTSQCSVSQLRVPISPRLGLPEHSVGAVYDRPFFVGSMK